MVKTQYIQQLTNIDQQKQTAWSTVEHQVCAMLRKNDAKACQGFSFRSRGVKTKSPAGSIEKTDKPR